MSPRDSWELKSQYGHLRTHHGMWIYSDNGGGWVGAEEMTSMTSSASAAGVSIALISMDVLIGVHQFIDQAVQGFAHLRF